MDGHAFEARGSKGVTRAVQDLREELSREDVKVSRKRAYTRTVGRYPRGTKQQRSI